VAAPASTASSIGRTLHARGHPDGSARLRIGMIAPPWFGIPPSSYGGIESICHWLVEGLRARGHHVVLAAAGSSPIQGSFVQTYAKPPSARLGELLPELVHAAEARRGLDSMALDVIHDHSAAGPLTAGHRNIPTVVTAHGPVGGELGRFYRALGDRISLVAISDAQRRAAPDLRWLGTVHNAIPTSEYPYRAFKEDFLLFLGRLSRDKGADLALEAARATGRSLILAGKCTEPSERQYFEREIRPQLTSAIEYVGEVDVATKKDLLSRARCLLFPIRWEEPFGIVMIEAMACGTPVVALKAGSVPEVVCDGTTGFICQEAAELPEAIEATGALNARDCRDHVRRSFDVRLMVESYEQAYRELLRHSATVSDRQM
jgi:glycosyltransferase involved in cell wall biosynthesis